MGLTRKAHDKKADQETQSPVIKVFKDIMQISENANNPEKANLLKEKREKKKKRYSGQKPQQEVKSGDTSSEHHFNPVNQHSYSQPKSQSVFHSEKRDSWWTWGGADKNQEDTCSCVSCALKKIVTQRSGIMSCLAIFLALSGVLAIYLAISTMPKTYTATDDLSKSYEEVAKTAKPEGDKRERRSELLGKGMQDRSIWDESKSRLMSGLSDLYGADFSENSLHDGGNILGGSRGVKTELSSFVDPNKLSEGYGSNRLRSFYKKLIETDMQIRNLKKSIREATPMTPNDFSDLGLSRAKRSLKHVTNPRGRPLANMSAADHEAFKDLHVYFPPAPVIQVTAPRGQKVKRFINESGPSGFVIENKKLVVKFKQYPKRHKVHSHSQFRDIHKLHNNQPIHPLLKDTAKLDEILTRLIEKNVPDAIFDPFGLRTITPLLTTGSYPLSDDYVLASDHPYNLIPNPIRNIVEYTPETITLQPTNEATTDFQHTSVDNFGHVLSMSTILNSEAKKQLDLISRVPNIRRLLQVEVDGENEEVANDEEENREKRTGVSDANSQGTTENLPKAVHNPNWKGPMPLYPDELNSIIKQAAMKNIRKVEVPVNKDNVADNAKDISDTEYVEDYVNNKYNKLVKMAQAYSDYGVLEDKKDMRVEKNNKALENRVKLSVQKGLGLLGRLKKSKSGLDPEGIRFEYKPNSAVPKENKEKFDGDFFKFGSHLKITSNQPQPERETPSINIKNYEFLYSNAAKPKAQNFPKESMDMSGEDDSPVYFGRHKRSLMSVNEDDGKGEPIEVQNDAQSNKVTLYRTTSLNSISSTEYSPHTNVYTISTIPNANELTTERSSFTKETSIEPDRLENANPSKGNTEFTKLMVNASIDSKDKRNTDTDVKPGEIFGLIIDWFKLLSGLEMDEDHVNETNILTDFLTMVHPERIPIMPLHYYTKSEKFTTRKPMYPMFDSEMVENIGHRSRVLLSIEEKDNTTLGNKDEKDKNKRSGDKVADKESTNFTSSEINKVANVSNVSDDVSDKSANAAIENKTVKKRSAPDRSNLIFWNDMYDDEYGIKDPLENSVRDKHSAKLNDVMAKSENWFGMKLRKIADSVRNNKRSNGRTQKQPGLRDKTKKIFKRDALFEDSDKQTFAALTASMKKICREAAQAVHETKNQAPSRSSEGDAASSLMQQLVGLMSDLVEIQVQQKTCVRESVFNSWQLVVIDTPLPPDLRSFLVWLTSPNPEENNPQMQSFDELDNNIATGQQTENMPGTSPSDMYPLDVRTECLGTIHDVEDLIQLYDEMSEEDKSKMSGVREYLENQLDFLHKQLSTFDGYKSESPMQFSRRRRHHQQRRPRIRRKLYRFLKNFGKKRTRSTMSFDTEPFTDHRKTSRNYHDAIGHSQRNDAAAAGNEDAGKTKRNLPDVYYRAVADNTTTIRNASTRN